MLTPQKCSLGNICQNMALPCTRHCADHIMYNVDQLLFEHCTAKFADNTQCCAPVFDITHEMPLCREHARKWVIIVFFYIHIFYFMDQFMFPVYSLHLNSFHLDKIKFKVRKM